MIKYKFNPEFSITKNTTKLDELQQFKSDLDELCTTQYDPIPCQRYKENPLLILKELSKSGKSLINLLIWFRRLNFNASIWASQTWIAQKLGISRRQVIRLMDALWKIGIIAKDYRHLQTSRYKISSWFFKKEIRSKLARFFSNLAILSAILLTVPNNAFNDSIERNVTVFTPTNIYISSLNCYGNTTRAHTRTDISNGNSMNNEESFNRLITPELQKLTDSLGLTQIGQAKLLAYPVESHRYALKSIGLISTAINPFEYLCAILSKWCTKNNHKPNWSQVYLVMQAYKLNEDEPRLDKSKIKRVEKKVYSQNRDKYEEQNVVLYKPFVSIPDKPEDEERMIANYEHLFSNPNPWLNARNWLLVDGLTEKEFIEREVQKNREKAIRYNEWLSKQQ
jgi:hypothetical protein